MKLEIVFEDPRNLEPLLSEIYSPGRYSKATVGRSADDANHVSVLMVSSEVGLGECHVSAQRFNRPQHEADRNPALSSKGSPYGQRGWLAWGPGACRNEEVLDALRPTKRASIPQRLRMTAGLAIIPHFWVAREGLT